ncbi:hypothetical protein SAMN05421543_101457 [Alicyclobacillus macrosporangiidus]|jgi:hypothetical protein|uniref:Uncharacterized protein n=1 Tax=Alicyclobacillus macrosporangiidus TaxID=392015 RepID=A0A1I7FUB1_9BACL|nr:hypothetical protein SAMN05421543_101457 [Alicyclobacillus macrosporangiidus]
MDARIERRLHWVHRLDAAVPSRYCWAGLRAWALRETGKNAARCGDYCWNESRIVGACYCGKFMAGQTVAKMGAERGV